jgi:hypothetical protein
VLPRAAFTAVVTEVIRMTARAIVLAGLLALAPLNQALSWGNNGHSIIAEIAQRRLHPQVWIQIENLMGKQVSLASIASWADDLVQQRPDTINWHFVNIPYDATDYVSSRDCRPTPKGDCVINAIARARATLDDRSAPRQQRAEALMFLVHFVGDVHQPLHTIDRKDEGGNKLAVTFFDVPMPLHAVWDIGLVEKRTFDWGHYVTILEDTWLPGKDIRDLQRGTPADWALQAHAAAVDVAYVLPEDLKLGNAYYQRSLPTLDRQLALAGLRLARLLNEAFGHAGYSGTQPLARRPM